jgi:hypothetical protein
MALQDAAWPLTPSPMRSSSSTGTSPRLIPTRSSMRWSGTPSLRWASPDGDYAFDRIDAGTERNLTWSGLA